MSHWITNAYNTSSPEVPDWLNKGDNAWQFTAATFVGLQSMPGLVVLYGSIVKKKWAVNSAFMALYAFAAALIFWVLLGFRMAFGERLLPFWGKGGPALSPSYLIQRAHLASTTHYFHNGTMENPMEQPFYPMATLVLFEFMYAAITLIVITQSIEAHQHPKPKPNQ